MRLIPLSVVREGVYLAQTLYNSDGKALLMKGTKLSNRYINKIKEHGFYSIYIFDQYSEQELEDIIKPQVRRKAINTISSIYNDFIIPDDNNTNEFRKKRIAKERQSSFEEIQKMAKLIVDDIFSQPKLLISLVDIKSLDTYTYNHSVNVGILALTIGISYGLNRNDLYDLTLGCMLHDVGKIFIPSEILNKPDKLTDEEFNVIKEHCEKGFAYLRENTDLGPKVRIISLQHQERFDGSGYPQGLKGDEINILSQIASVADVYDALTSDRPYRKALSPHEAVEYLMGSGGRYFNMDLVKSFLQRIIPFPVGTVVKLSNGFIGTVEKIHSDMLLRPVIKVFRYNDENITAFLCDLAKEKNIVIKNIVYDV
ncbi:HD-GYP domain-containing protein [Paramaledivibacter caminithermalis]|uniref:HD-GYP domain, c-di-GMP phosphodiesterase class II (Or its inactivated variant) n=1 Tax=Paramaledivibacter caminithermalis (strain DSM 15212 / CIP 107654 / DViRD3) TaxID=1121301 RepID=A0A1M6JLH0_PARC5|nr:HD-GYP domain-containing protein [Paramaledivibacter caminithermalis]SHJ47464.1 HD-GYP domain, c-di-GMP phosphodiesterase class II (or its inactivated variant) [Paramaledivibacter caminithermalis DSM 15212]